MPISNYVFDEGEAVEVGTQGDTNFLYHSGEPVPNTGVSDLVFEAGVGIGGQGAIIDDWEDGDLSEYPVNDGGSWSITTSDVFEGTYAVRGSAGGLRQQLMSDGGLENYPEAGDTFEWHVKPISSSGNDVGIYYGLFDAQSSGQANYRLSLFPTENYIRLRIRPSENASYDFIADTNGEFNTGTYYRVEVDWGSDGTHTVTGYNAETGTQVWSMSGTDDRIKTGGIGWRVQDTEAVVDLARIIG